jgi:hypothetical protein
VPKKVLVGAEACGEDDAGGRLSGQKLLQAVDELGLLNLIKVKGEDTISNGAVFVRRVDDVAKAVVGKADHLTADRRILRCHAHIADSSQLLGSDHLPNCLRCQWKRLGVLDR